MKRKRGKFNERYTKGSKGGNQVSEGKRPKVNKKEKKEGRK